jgi:hypothetical protein
MNESVSAIPLVTNLYGSRSLANLKNQQRSGLRDHRFGTFGRQSPRRNKKTVTRTEWHSNKLRPAHAAQQASDLDSSAGQGRICAFFLRGSAIRRRFGLEPRRRARYSTLCMKLPASVRFGSNLNETTRSSLVRWPSNHMGKRRRCMASIRTHAAECFTPITKSCLYVDSTAAAVMIAVCA